MTMTFLHHAWQVTVELAPWLFLGLLVAGLLRVCVPNDLIERHLGHGYLAVVKAVLIGVPMPLCSCGVIPAALGIKKQGASNGAAIGFLISTPQTGVDSIVVSAKFLGLPFALFKVASALVTGLVGGALVHWAEKPGPAAVPARPVPTCAPASRGNWLTRLLDYSLNELLYMIWVWLLVGIVVSAAITTWVPANLFANYAITSGVGALFVVLAISLPLYVCATSSVPIAAALVQAGMPPGAALVFLLAGPASNVATIGAVYRGFGGKVLGIYLATISSGSLLCGYLFDAVLKPTAAAGHLHEHSTAVGVASAVLLLGCFAWFAVRDLRQRLTRKTTAAPDMAAETLQLKVGGMTCQNCARHVKEALLAVPDVTQVEVDLAAGQATVRGRRLAAAALREAIAAAGYDPG